MDLIILSHLVEDAKIAYSDSPVMQQVVVTQAIHESGFANKSGGSKLALKYNNLFGIKAKAGQQSVTMRTWEHIKGKDIQVNAEFAWYDDYTHAFYAHKELMSKPRYARVLQATTVKAAFKALYLSGYATDPKYPAKLEAVYDKWVAKEFLSKPSVSETPKSSSKYINDLLHYDPLDGEEF